jgi:hypothetical protein
MEGQSKLQMYRCGGCRGCRIRPGQDVEKEVEEQWWISPRSKCNAGYVGLVQSPGVD